MNSGTAVIEGLQSLKSTLFHALHKPVRSNRLGRWIGYFLTALILANCAAVAIETVPSAFAGNEALFAAFELFSTCVFLIEYVTRLWVCVEQTRFKEPVAGRIRYALGPLQLLDLLVIATYWAPFDFRFVRVFRITRLLRVLHLEELDQSFQKIMHALGKRRHLLIIAVASMLAVAYSFAALLFMVEHPAQPDKFTSIPETIWWAVVTLTTIGYGDITPITPLGKALSAGISLVGIGVFALPSAIVTAAILEAGVDDDATCPHCGKRTNVD